MSSGGSQYSVQWGSKKTLAKRGRGPKVDEYPVTTLAAFAALAKQIQMEGLEETLVYDENKSSGIAYIFGQHVETPYDFVNVLYQMLNQRGLSN